MPVQKGAPAPSKLFITKPEPTPAAAPPPQVVVAPPPQQGMNLKDIADFLKAVPPVVWERLLAPKPAQAPAAPASTLPAGAVVVQSDGPPASRQAPAAGPATPAAGPAMTELQGRIGRLSDDDAAKLAVDLLGMLPPAALKAKVIQLLPMLVSEEHAVMACHYMSENLPATNPPK